ncbi:MAG TPA: hypothetical protein PKA88_04870 [Polyangiaceae bacterium]|nr:hypothetical protein [Polyangiaceae bacterium]HMR75093.1 hypothetical protein [Polyangiaceae bacterium]
MAAPVPIASLVVDGVATVEGQVRRTDAALLEAPASGRQCVAYVVSSGVLTGALDQAGQAFFLKDESGEILVLPERFTARLGHRETLANLSVVDADVRAVSDSLSALRDKLKQGRTPELVDEQRTLRKLYTLLCAIRAHSRGHCHVGKSLEGQERFIAKNTALFEHEYAPRKLRTFKLMREETILAVGDYVRVTGKVEQRVHALAGGAGYRERATLLTITAPAEELLVLIAEGASQAEAERHQELVAAKSRPARSFTVIAWCLLGVVVALAWAFTR